MSFAALFQMLGPAVGIAVAVALGLMTYPLLAFWKGWEHARWVRAAMPLALAAGFVAGYAMLFELPTKLDDEIWKWVAVSALFSGGFLTVAQAIPRKLEWIAWGLLVVTVTWVTGRRIPEDRCYYMAGIAAAMVLYLAANWPVARNARMWALWPAVMLVCGIAAVAMVMPFELNHGRMFFVLASLAGTCLVAGIVPIARPMIAGGGVLPAMIFAVLVTTAAFYMVPETYPRSLFYWVAAAPLGAGVAWAPWLRKRPWRCAAAAITVTAALLVPAIVIAVKNAPPMDL